MQCKHCPLIDGILSDGAYLLRTNLAGRKPDSPPTRKPLSAR